MPLLTYLARDTAHDAVTPIVRFWHGIEAGGSPGVSRQSFHLLCSWYWRAGRPLSWSLCRPSRRPRRPV